MDSTEKIPDASFLKSILFRAFAISLLIHLALFGGWKLGQARGWFKESHIPNWLRVLQKSLVPQLVKLPQPQPKRETPLMFVDVDPALAVAEPPKETKFYGAANSVKATTEQKKESELPTIKGTQENVLKTTDNSQTKAQPLQPSPPREEKPKAPKPEPRPKPTPAPGDLALAKPQEKTQKESAESEPQPRRLKKTVAEAKALRGEKMQHDGGATRLAMTSSLDVKRTAIGDYDRELVDAVQQAWDASLKDRQTNPGKVVIEFHLHYDGRITGMKVVESDVPEMLALLCERAVLNPAPYKKWPPDMRREVGSDDRHVTFTFFYY